MESPSFSILTCKVLTLMEFCAAQQAWTYGLIPFSSILLIFLIQFAQFILLQNVKFPERSLQALFAQIVPAQIFLAIRQTAPLFLLNREQTLNVLFKILL